MRKNEKGITLVALIITIIVLLILATVSIMAVTGTGLFAKTSDAVEKYQNSTEKENSIMDNHVAVIDSYIKGKSGSTPKIYGTDSDYIVIMPDGITAYLKFTTFSMSSPLAVSVGTFKPSHFASNIQNQSTDFTVTSDANYKFIYSESTPIFIYNDSIDAWYLSGLANSDTEVYVGSSPITVYSGSNSETILNEINSLS